MAQVQKLHAEAEQPVMEALNFENENLKSLVMTYENEISALKEKILTLQQGLKDVGLNE